MTENEELRWLVEFHKALGNENRLEILDLIGDEELCQCEIFPKMGLAQSTISAYLSQLVRVGILMERRDGTRKLYKIREPIQAIIQQTQDLAHRMS